MKKSQNKKNIAILFPASKEFGGTYQYAISILYSLANFSKKYNLFAIYYNKDDLEYFNYNFIDNKKENIEKFTSKYKVLTIKIKNTPLIKKIAMFLNLVLNLKLFNMQINHEKELLNKHNIDLLIIPYPSLFGYRNQIPYIVTIPDIMHKYFPNLPEYTFKVRLRRDFEYKYCAKHSILTIGDSIQGINDINKFLKIPLNKCKVINYMPPGYIFEFKDMTKNKATEVLKKYNLPKKYLFYPAQFWSHKNHLRLIKAIHLLKEKYKIIVNAVFVGSAHDSYNSAMRAISDLKLEQQIIHLGYVSSIELVALYKDCYSLVYPSLIGPTNIPPIEALILETPILCSNVFGMPEQVKDAAILFNPYSIEDIAEKIKIIWTDNEKVKELIKNGKIIADNLNYRDYSIKWENTIDEALKVAKAL